jgi:hypothetical protein
MNDFGGVSNLYMRKLFLMLALPLLILQGSAQTRNCLRVMSVEELSQRAILIARVKVHKTDDAKYRGMFAQVAILRPLDVIEGDFTLKELNVLARSNVRCAEDNYIKAQEMLVFLEPEDSLFHTLNYQYGQFLIVDEIVKGWRDKAGNPIDKPYTEVRQEIAGYVKSAHSPKTEPQTVPQPIKPPVP